MIYSLVNGLLYKWTPQSSMIYLHSSSSSPWRSVLYCFGDTRLDDLDTKHVTPCRRSFPSFGWNRGKGPFQKEKFHLPTSKVFRGELLIFGGCKRFIFKKKRERERQKKGNTKVTSEKTLLIKLHIPRKNSSKERLVPSQFQPFQEARRVYAEEPFPNNACWGFHHARKTNSHG